MLNEKLICAGFGGQGVMSLGQLLTYAGMLEDKHVSWLPSYGPEMRGGTAYCCVMLSDEPIGSPVIVGDATCALILNLPSLIKFESSVAPSGSLILNSSLVKQAVQRSDIAPYYVPANDIARECGNEKAANMVMLGAYLEISMAVTTASVIQAFTKVFSKKAEQLLDLNVAAIKSGMAAVREDSPLNKAA